MERDSTQSTQSASAWQPKVVYGLAFACLVLGLFAGYLLRGSGTSQTVASAGQAPSAPLAAAPHQHPPATIEQMKQVADKQAQPLLEELKADPKNKTLLLRAAQLYKASHQFQEAVSYFTRALQVDPTDVSVRTEMASCLYYNGDAEGAIAQLQQSLKYSPKDANSLFNLGMIKWKGKNDPAGAVATWEQLLRSNPKLDRRAVVERMISEARQEMN